MRPGYQRAGIQSYPFYPPIDFNATGLPSIDATCLPASWYSGLPILPLVIVQTDPLLIYLLTSELAFRRNHLTPIDATGLPSIDPTCLPASWRSGSPPILACLELGLKQGVCGEHLQTQYRSCPRGPCPYPWLGYSFFVRKVSSARLVSSSSGSLLPACHRQVRHWISLQTILEH